MATEKVVQNIIQQQVLKAAEIIEERIDEEIRQLDELKSDDIESLRERRLLQLKLQAKRKQEYLAKVRVVCYNILFQNSSVIIRINLTGAR